MKKRERLYTIWHGMKQRCYNPNNKNYPNYGGRGIKVCKQWRESYTAFRDWALSHGYQDDLTIERIDNNGNYKPDNCKWSTRAEQNRNKRPPKPYQKQRQQFEINGVSKSAIEWAAELEMTVQGFRKRWDGGDRGDELLREPRGADPLPVKRSASDEKQKVKPKKYKLPVKRTITPEEQTAK